MADPSPNPAPYLDSSGDAGHDADSTPRWVYVFGGIALVVVLLFVILLLTGGGSHGPGRH